MIHQVRRFVSQFFPVVHRRRERRFHTFFAHLLSNALRTSSVEARGVGRGGIGPLTGREEHFQIPQELPTALQVPKAARRPQVTGRPLGVYRDEQRILVAVCGQIHEI